MLDRSEQFQDYIARLFPDEHININICDVNKTTNSIDMTLSRTVTFQVTEDCNLCCSYCYQTNKHKNAMSFDIAKEFIDILLSGEKGMSQYINSKNSPGIVIEFIGGEPFLEIDLIDKITTYFYQQLIDLHHPWLNRFIISICSNGILYFDERVQRFLQKHKNHLSFSISIDGNKELHDSCRVFKDGSGSYDIAIAGVKHYTQVLGGVMGSKMTLCPQNIIHTSKALKSLIETGYREIFLNCVYEKGWEQNDATILYNQLTKIADYIFENNLEEDIYISMFENNIGCEKNVLDVNNWCWGKGTPILTEHGYIPIEDLSIGDLVYTEDGSLHPIVNTTSHLAENVVEISMSGIFKLICTDNHKLYVQPFDYLGNKDVKHFKEYGQHEVKNIRHKDLINLFQLPERYIDFDCNLAYLVGRYIGDGWDYQNGRGHGICCSFDEVQELAEKFNIANVDFHYRKHETVAQFTISRNTKKSNNEILHNILSDCGHLAHNKHLPIDSFKWNNTTLSYLLNGYMDADGHKTKSGHYKFSTVSYRLAQEMMTILRTLGHTPTCNKNKRAGKSIIQNYEVYYYSTPHKGQNVHIFNNKMWTYGLKQRPVESQQVFNITVDTNHSYIAGGITSSNCGGNGSMIALDWKGDIFPCIRYMETSLNSKQKPLKIGDIENGIMSTDETKKCVDCLTCINRKTQSTDECFYCPIAEGCSWCSAYHYEEFGTPNKRATYICEMHKARVLANVYFWNKYYIKTKQNKCFKNNVPDEWALKIITENQLQKLKSLETREK